MKIVLFLACLLIASHAAEPRWWKGNLHTHTLWSDGDDFPEMVAAWYKGQGYNFLGLSDHNIIADKEQWISIAKRKLNPAALPKYKERFGDKWVELRDKEGDQEVRLKMLTEFRPALEEPEKFLMIPCEEITGGFLSSPIHINATNIREKIPPQKGSSFVEVMQKTLAAVYAQRERLGVPMFPHINHPNFGWALTAEDLAQVDRDRFFEVYNGHPQVNNEGNKDRANTDRIWDILLTKRLAERGTGVVYALGVDDSHHYHPTVYSPPATKEPAKDAPAKDLPAKPDAPKDAEAAEQKESAPKDGAPKACDEPKADAAKSDAPDASAAKPVGPNEAAAKDLPAKPATPKKPGNPSRPGRGWIMVRAEKLDAESIVAAMEAGDFYASSGVTLKDVVREKNRLAVEIAPEEGVTYTTEFFGTRKGYDGASEPVVDAKGVTLRTTRRYSKDVGAVLATVQGTSASYELKGDEIYVRARVTSSKVKANPSVAGEFERAWTQPVVTGVK
jgi:hypothetical protein